MKIFRVNDEDKLIQYREEDFKQNNLEKKLETWLENNPHCILEDEQILIIGRQIYTSFGSFIDLLAVDRGGDLVVIELKRDRTPRETIAQLLEYTAFVEVLSYQQLEEIFIGYMGEEQTSLTDYHKNYFQLQEEEAVAFNKNQKLFIIAQKITKEIKGTATFLRKKQLDIYCLEFKYFSNRKQDKLISIDYVIGNDTLPVKNIYSGALPRIDRQMFLNSLDNYGKPFFGSLFNFADNHNLTFHWGSKGFSLNIYLDKTPVNLLFGYPPHAIYKQSMKTICTGIINKIHDGESIAEHFKQRLNSLNMFQQSGSELKLLINRHINEEELSSIQNVLLEVINKIRKQGLKE